MVDSAAPTMKDVEERNRRVDVFLAQVGVSNADFNAMVEKMRKEVPTLADGTCRSALYALAASGYWPRAGDSCD